MIPKKNTYTNDGGSTKPKTNTTPNTTKRAGNTTSSRPTTRTTYQANRTTQKPRVVPWTLSLLECRL